MNKEELESLICSGCGSNITSNQQYQGYIITHLVNRYHQDCFQDYLNKYGIAKARFVKGKDYGNSY
jgi:hypothetical protein